MMFDNLSLMCNPHWPTPAHVIRIFLQSLFIFLFFQILYMLIMQEQHYIVKVRLRLTMQSCLATCMEIHIAEARVVA